MGFVLFPPTASATTFHLVMVWSAVAISIVSALDIVRRGWVETRVA
ncbi:MAG: hypothetical protein R6X23_08360 [Acidimicrobiia bacterium]